MRRHIAALLVTDACGLRDYGTGSWAGGDPDCDHARPRRERAIGGRDGNAFGTPPSARDENTVYYDARCGKCGATRTDSQIGLEATPELFIAEMVAVFREVRRVLADHGTLWLNLGDSYARNGGDGDCGPNAQVGNTTKRVQSRMMRVPASQEGSQPAAGAGLSLKPKDLVGIPWRVAFALQADGWYLRSDIVWAKPNPMPESVTDRPTKSHEYVFLLAKGQWKARVVAFSDLHGEVVHLREHVGAKDANVWAHEFAVRFASAILDSAEGQQDFSLPPLDSEVWKKLPDDRCGFSVAGLPVEHRASALASRFLSANVSAKEFLCEFERLGVALTDRDHFKVGGGPAEFSLPRGVDRYGETAVAIHDSGEIGEVDFAAHTLKYSRPVGCSYFFDQEAVREPFSGGSHSRGSMVARDLPKSVEPGQRIKNNTSMVSAIWGQPAKPTPQSETLDGSVGEAPRGPDGRRQTHVAAGDASIQHRDGERWPGTARNIRSVWEIATQPYPDAHFATFPEALPERCIKAGCPERVCGTCGKASERIVERGASMDVERGSERLVPSANGRSSRKVGGAYQEFLDEHPKETVGWSDCGHDNWRTGTVLDPFMGSGTTALVARRLGRKSVGVELNPEYAALCARRLQQLSLLAEETA